MTRLTYADKNRLCYGDCLDLMREMPAGVVDLIYLDPPFNSNRDYNAIYTDETGNPLPAQVEAFKDTWQPSDRMHKEIEKLFDNMLNLGLNDERANFLQKYLKEMDAIDDSLQAYLTYMAVRIVEMHRVLKSTGSIYLHCDPTASHYLKTVMDCIFGPENYRNEIAWGYHGNTSTATNFFPRKHDVILFYATSRKTKFNPQFLPYTPEQVKRFTEKEKDGRRYYWNTNRSRGRHKIYMGEGVKVGSNWTDIQNLTNPKELTGYPTQKPLALLKRIIKSSSNEGDFVLDPFCGCATTIEAAHILERRWMGIDAAIYAIKRVARLRLGERIGLQSGKDYEIIGIPRDIEGAIDMWERDPYHFQSWIVGEVGGYDTGPSAGGKVDGRIWYKSPDNNGINDVMAIEVKGGKNINPDFLHGLISVLKTQKHVKMGGLVTMRPITGIQLANFSKLISQVGSFEVNKARYDRVQLLSVEEILKGKRFDIPGQIQGHDEGAPVMPGLRG